MWVAKYEADIGPVEKAGPVAAQEEPVAWMTINAYGEEDDIHYENPEGHLLYGWTYKPLYTRPQAREWVGLTEEEIEQLENDTCTMEFPDTTRAIEAKLREKNT